MTTRALPLTLLLLLVSGCAWFRPPGDSASPPPNPVLFGAAALPSVARELIEMADRSRTRRTALTAEPEPDPEALRELVRIDQANAIRLREIIARYDWPGPNLVGPRAARDAWEIVWYAEHMTAFQADALERVRPLVPSATVPAEEFAHLTDRVRVARNQAQVYGTQHRILARDGQLFLQPTTPIEDPANLDARRAALGLDPQADHLARLKAQLTGRPADTFVEQAPTVDE